MNTRLLTMTMLAGMLVFSGCGDDDEEPINPIVGEWELDDATLVISGSSFYGFENENSLFGESAYTLLINADNTFEREIEDIPGFGDIDEEGEWTVDEDELELNPEDDEVDGLEYFFEIIENDQTSLTLEYTASQTIFPDQKITEWFEDGTINSSGQFDVTQEEFDSLFTNFAVQAQGRFTLEFDKRN